MSSRFIALVALLLVLTTACDQSKSGVTETPTATVSITLGLSASEIGAATVEFFVSNPTALPQPITGTVAVADPVTSFTLTQIPVVALGDPYTLFLVARTASTNSTSRALLCCHLHRAVSQEDEELLHGYFLWNGAKEEHF